MPAIDSFRARIKTLLVAGNTLDIEIDECLRDAVSAFETDINLKYQERFVSFSPAAGANSFPFPERPKHIKWVRRIDQNGNKCNLDIVEGWQESLALTGYPTFCWLDNQQFLRFDQVPSQEVLNFQLFYLAFSAWPLAEDSKLWSDYRRHILYRTMADIAVVARKPELAAYYTTRYDNEMVKLQVLADASGEAQQDAQMQFVPHNLGD
jgi:hypothetical protein